MGWLRISDQFNSIARSGVDDLRAIFTSCLYRLLHGLFILIYYFNFSFLFSFFIFLFIILQVYAIGTILSMQISFVGFQPIETSEHMAVGFCFFSLQLQLIFFFWRQFLQIR
jgi:hypothetical protein